MKPIVCSLALAVFAAGVVSAQPAPRDTVSVTLNGGKVTVEYGRPSLKGRSFAELMKSLPADRMWRAGSEKVTVLTTQLPLIVGNQMVAPGKYSVYVHCPEGGPYSLVLNRDLGQPLKNLWAAAPAEIANDPYPSFDYANQIAKQEVVRAEMKKETTTQAVDQFTISLEPAGKGASLKMAWGDQLWSLALLPAPNEGSGSHKH
ncbi:MAG: hypothetical protein Kow001_14050 [Acidobacteriota bacterium]